MESSRPTVQTLFESGQAVVDSAGGFIILMAKVDGHIMIFSIIRQFLTYDPFPKVESNYVKYLKIPVIRFPRLLSVLSLRVSRRTSDQPTGG